MVQNLLNHLVIYIQASKYMATLIICGMYFRPTWQNIILGQFLSLLLCIQTILSHYMNKGTVGVLLLPTGQSFPHYMLLCVIYTTWLACRGGNNGLISVLKTRGWRYFLLSLIDVQANTLISASHQFTTIASIQV